MAIDTDMDIIDQILNRGVITEVLPGKQEFKELLASGNKLRFYIGVDPTSASLHLSHAKNYMLLEEFRLLGHEVIVLFGDFTARIGDPSDRETARSQLTAKEVDKNVSEWLRQIEPLMNFKTKHNPPKVLYNSEWLAKMTFEEVIGLASNFTVQQMIERDMFQKRLKDNQPIYMHEFFYPLMQGYDSVAMEVDVELCGRDQTFNALAGRTLTKRLLGKDKYVVVVNLMENPKTGELMSKSKGRGVFLDGTAKDMYGAVMAQPDEMIKPLLINNTRLPLDEVSEVIKLSARDAKSRTAYEITTIFHGAVSAQEAQAAWERQFSQGELPEEIAEVTLGKSQWGVVELLQEAGLVNSKSEARRLIEQDGIKINGSKIRGLEVDVKNGDVLQAGKRRFKKLLLK